LLPPLEEGADAAPGAAAPAVPVPAPAAAAPGAGRDWLQEEVLAELQGPLALNSKPEARWGRWDAACSRGWDPGLHAVGIASTICCRAHFLLPTLPPTPGALRRCGWYRC
jgi:hypothetical protein